MATHILFQKASMKQQTMPQLKDILGGRKQAVLNYQVVEQEHSQLDAFGFFCYNILECAAGKQEWKLEKVRKTVSTSYVTVSD